MSSGLLSVAVSENLEMLIVRRSQKDVRDRHRSTRLVDYGQRPDHHKSLIISCQVVFEAGNRNARRMFTRRIP
jgi:hypothetical protein